MASLNLEKLHPFMPAEDDKFPRPGSGWRHEITSVLLLQQGLLHMFLPWDHHGAFVRGAILSHQNKWVSVAALSTQSHQGPSHGCSSTQECIQEGAVIKALLKLGVWTEDRSSSTEQHTWVCAHGGRRRWAGYSRRVWISVLLQVTCLHLCFLQCEIMFICI